ncbi:MAG TPA: ion channel [Candidatus Binataceae bacterium]|nr:ion channel [Candidatus Binataceae bacterium]
MKPRDAHPSINLGGAVAGVPRSSIFTDLYHRVLIASWPGLLGFITAAYVLTNLLFALVYWIDGGVGGTRPGSFSDVFFFSVQTMATIGYGRMTPTTFLSNALMSVEALFGLVGLAMMTGLVFAKFSLPTARVRFSNFAVISRRDGVSTLMFRMANLRANRIVEAQMHVSLTRIEKTAEGETVRRWYDLAMLRDRSALFALSWTAQHRVDESSPLANATPESLTRENAALTVSITGLDETFSQTVHARHYYDAAAILFGKRLADIMTFTPGGSTEVDYSRFDDVVDAPLR